MRIVVFGAAGWTGRAVLANLDGRHEVRAVDLSPASWEEWEDMAGPWQAGEIVHADILDLNAVHEATEGMDGVVHLAVCFPREDPNDDRPFLVNLKGLWNVLEASRQCGVRRVVHVGSCCTVHPKGIFFTSEVRSAEGDLYGVCKRLQEEMCRQYHAAHGLGIVVLRPDYIVDSRLGVGRHRERLGSPEHPYRNGWVCRHDLAEACRLALEHETIDFDVFHIVGTPEADETCNVARSREILGLTYRGNLQQYR